MVDMQKLHLLLIQNLPFSSNTGFPIVHNKIAVIINAICNIKLIIVIHFLPLALEPHGHKSLINAHVPGIHASHVKPKNIFH